MSVAGAPAPAPAAAVPERWQAAPFTCPRCGNLLAFRYVDHWVVKHERRVYSFRELLYVICERCGARSRPDEG